jgi:acetyl esterase/lipase
MEPEAVGEAVQVYRGLEYAKYAEQTLQLDLYVPKEARGAVPCIVVIPGGGFRPTTKEKFGEFAVRLAENGFAGASIGYRGAPTDPFPAAVYDVKAATRFLRANAERFGLDAERFGAFGQSAGGHLAVMLAVTGGVEDLEGDGGNAGVSSRVQAAVSYAGVFDFISRLRDGGHQDRGHQDGGRLKDSLEKKRSANGAWVGEPFSPESARWKAASPFYYISGDDPPVLLVHCRDDGTAPFEQSIQMYEGVKTVRPESRLLLFERGGHNIRNSALVEEEAWRETLGFFRDALAGATGPRTDTDETDGTDNHGSCERKC